jgi:hypothetical protein
MTVSVSKNDLTLGEPVTASVGVGDLSSGKPLADPAHDPGGVSVDWGDKSTAGSPKLEDFSFEHVYTKPGTYTVVLKEGGQFKWHSDRDSCSFVCRAERKDTIVVRKALSAEQLTKLLEQDKSPEGKKDLAKQKAILLKSQVR